MLWIPLIIQQSLELLHKPLRRKRFQLKDLPQSNEAAPQAEGMWVDNKALRTILGILQHQHWNLLRKAVNLWAHSLFLL